MSLNIIKFFSRRLGHEQLSSGDKLNSIVGDLSKALIKYMNKADGKMRNYEATIQSLKDDRVESSRVGKIDDSIALYKSWHDQVFARNKASETVLKALPKKGEATLEDVGRIVQILRKQVDVIAARSDYKHKGDFTKVAEKAIEKLEKMSRVQAMRLGGG